MRAPDATRQKLLAVAFEEFYRHGFQAASMHTILEKAGVSKGGLYHHFVDKAALGYAVVDEVIRNPVLDAYLGSLEQDSDDPLTTLQNVLRQRPDHFITTGINQGCPLNNLAQEMSPLDEEFRLRLAATFEAWIDGFAVALERAQERGIMRPEVDARAVARLLVAAIEGSFGLAKNAQSVDLLRANLEMLANFLDGLRTPTPA
ncbi:MAG: TetR family transcriptional regulator C-terminal domain-containing protein [Longimicrobiales bacterium]